MTCENYSWIALASAVGGALTVTVAGHPLTTSDKVKLTPNSINFNCNSDGNITTIGYPDKTSPIYDKFVGISQITNTTFTINAGSIPDDNWIQDLEIGGGRVLGEVCHFIDYLTYLNGSLPTKVSATALPDANHLNDTLNILIQFENENK